MKKLMAFVFKFIGKVFVLPLIMILTILQWICTLAVNISTLFFSLIGGIFIVAGILSFAFGQEPASMMWRMIATGAAICLLPQIGRWLFVQLTYLTLRLTNKVN